MLGCRESFWEPMKELPEGGSGFVQISGLLSRNSETDGQALAEYAIVACILAVIFAKCIGVFEQALFKYFTRIAQCFIVARFL